MDERESFRRPDDHLVEPFYDGLGAEASERSEAMPEDSGADPAARPFWIRWWHSLARGAGGDR